MCYIIVIYYLINTRHIVHTFTLDDERVDHFVKSTLGYGASDLAKKLGVMLLKSVLIMIIIFIIVIVL